MRERQRYGLVLLLVLGLLAASAVVIALKPTLLGLDLKGGVQLTYKALPTPQTPVVTQASLNQAVAIMESRVNQFGVSQAQIQTQGGDQIVASLPDVHNITRAENEIGSTAQLEFYDWEANVLLPTGATVASQLPLQNPKAVSISQGTGGAAPGDPGTGGVSLYSAVRLASRQQPAPKTQSLSRLNPVYYLFGAPGSTACATAARDKGTQPVAGEHCYLAGPDPTLPELQSDTSRPANVAFSEGQVERVPQGWVVLQASTPTASDTIQATSPNAQYFVLRDDAALSGNDITNPTASNQNGQPIVQFGFTSHGASAFQSTTAAIAHRGQRVSVGSHQLFQHFAASLDGQLLTVPDIDFTKYPDGIVNAGSSTAGASIQGSFTTQTAQDLATQLRLGSLPVQLKLISEEDISATLGAQALHNALIAGAVGLGIVVLFLILYYRILGLIATSTLIVYGFYFYALIKLVPITLSLAGIAGLILTIGIAADANIVIFERVKEEIRAGRSIRAGIATGYKKGLSAIIDANVVTIMVAFILFVLSTQSVQGFAFTLGIGTIVSLFTAVLATQAIMMTAGDSRLMARPSALGAGKPKRQIRFDFMGKSKYFFSLSGVILLVGALAIGGKGLNLGIDFTSGTTAQVTLARPATSAQVQSIAASVGAPSPTVVKVGQTGKSFRISFKGQGPNVARHLRLRLNSEFGIPTNQDWTATSIGPTFGSTVANEAIIAIIATLVLVSLYVALRFDRKFTIPVLIGLTHDILITAGVYALVGRQVTVDTVAALLTILGYALYDTIIVFDRIRENIPRMPRAAFSQIVNRSMSEVITRSLATSFCTLLPVTALVVFGDSTLRDFGFALLIGVASAAYCSIFIASPVLTELKEREPQFRHRRQRIEAEFGYVPAYATTAADIEPKARKRSRVTLSEVGAGEVSADEFEELKRGIAEEELEPAGRASTLTRRAARTSDEQLQAPQGSGQRRRPAARAGANRSGARKSAAGSAAPISRSQRLRAEAAQAQAAAAAQQPGAPQRPPTPPLDPAVEENEPDLGEDQPDLGEDQPDLPADQPELPSAAADSDQLDELSAPKHPGNGSQPSRPNPRRRNRRHGRRR